MKNNSPLAEGLRRLSTLEQISIVGGNDERNFLYDLGMVIGSFLVKLWRTPPGDGCEECIPMMI